MFVNTKFGHRLLRLYIGCLLTHVMIIDHTYADDNDTPTPMKGADDNTFCQIYTTGLLTKLGPNARALQINTTLHSIQCIQFRHVVQLCHQTDCVDCCDVFELAADDTPFVSDDDELNANNGTSSRPLGIQHAASSQSVSFVVHTGVHTSAVSAGSGIGACENITVTLAAQTSGAEMRQHGETALVLAGTNYVVLWIDTVI